jgi:phosphate-selective porin
VTVGQLDAPLSRERLTSSNAITFLERASPVRAFAPGTKAGVQLSYGADDAAFAGALGVFGDARHPDGAHTTNGAPRLIGRLIWAPPRLTDPANGRVLQLGVAGEYVLERSTTLRYKSTPESWLALPVVDTGTLHADHAFLPGLELAIQRGASVLEAEALGAVVDLDDHGPDLFWGGYVALGTMLTGETRPYDRRRGTFGMPTPRTPFSFRERRWRGAWEIAARYA